jgi:hypothetical protein
LYIAVYLSLRRQGKRKAHEQAKNGSKVQMNHNPAFLIYPLIYVMCTLPLALGRIATMAGAHVPLGYYCFAGTLIASNGSFDCLLFGTTRHAIVFSATDDVDVEDTGLETFAFMRTPEGQFGNTIWIQGGSQRPKGTGVGGWWVLGGDAKAPHLRSTRTVSQESLRSEGQAEMAIQMDVVTSVAVEIDAGKDRDPRFPDPARSETPSINSGEKSTMRGI